MISKKVALFLKQLSEGVSTMEGGDLKANWELVAHLFVWVNALPTQISSGSVVAAAVQG